MKGLNTLVFRKMYLILPSGFSNISLYPFYTLLLIMLTDRQKDALDFIRHYFHLNGKAPLIHEIAEGLGINSHSTTHRYVQALIEEGYLKRFPTRKRGLELIEEGESEPTITLPLMGKIAAGRLIEAIPDETEIDVSILFKGKDRYVLKISGESMTGKGIMSGDYVVIESTKQAQHGDIVVALVDDYDATLKTMFINKDHTITLMPANDAFEPITLDPNRLSIQGVMVGLLRTYS